MASSKIEQTYPAQLCLPLFMDRPIQILSVEQDGSDGLIVTFSDGTAAGYIVEELLNLRPNREPTKDRTNGEARQD